MDVLGTVSLGTKFLRGPLRTRFRSIRRMCRREGAFARQARIRIVRILRVRARTQWGLCQNDDKLEKYARIWEGHSDYTTHPATFSSLPVAYPLQNPTYSIRWPRVTTRLRSIPQLARTGAQPIGCQNDCLAERFAGGTGRGHIVLSSQRAGFVLIRLAIVAQGE
jgi:hypothetical protein